MPPTIRLLQFGFVARLTCDVASAQQSQKKGVLPLTDTVTFAERRFRAGSPRNGQSAITILPYANRPMRFCRIYV